MSTASQYVRLSTGYSMPLVGLGTYCIHGRETIYKVVDEALKAGYNSIDTAAVYRNEADIGHALSSGLLSKYGLERGDIFITTKLSPSDHGDPRKIRNSVEAALKALATPYIDLFLIHWPGAARTHENAVENIELRSITWQALVDLKTQGFFKSIGVSNYNIKHLELLLQDCHGERPAVNQVECHPHYRQEALRDFCQKEGIHVQAYSSLGTSHDTSLLTDLTVTHIASQLNVSPARCLLKWAVQQGIGTLVDEKNRKKRDQNLGVIPKAVQAAHIYDNVKLDFTLNEFQMQQLSSLPQKKYAWNPDNVV